MNARTSGFALAAGLLCACASAPRQAGATGFSPAPARGGEPLRFRAAAAYSREHAGDAVLVVRGDRTVFEEYQNGYTADVPHHMVSGTKSFACTIAAAAVEDSLLKLDEPLAGTLPELAEDRLGRGITARHLLSLTRGLPPVNRGPSGVEPANHYVNSLYLRSDAAPGTTFAYGPTSFDMFMEAMRRKLLPRREDPVAYLQRRVLDPIGVRGVTFARDGAGNAMFDAGARITAREWSRFGRMVRDHGRFEGRQVLDSAALGECFKGSAVAPWYGLAFWLNAPVRGGRALYDAGLPDMAEAIGAMHQHLFIISSLDLVVVRFGRPDDTFRSRVFLARLLGDPDPADPRPTPGEGPP
jgi:CubicO group peptidase (beta-lactamase class C family)